MHEIAGLQNPTQSFTVKKLMVAYQKTDSAPPIRKPITINILNQLIPELDYIQNPYLSKLYTSVFTIMYHGALRVSEVATTPRSRHTLTLGQVTLCNTKSSTVLKIKFKSFKHSRGHIPTFLIHPSKDSTCAVSAFKKFQILRGHKPGPLFSFQDGSALKSTDITVVLKRFLGHLGYDPSHYNTHSFRIGKITDLDASGSPHTTIRQIGRWNSNAYLKYIKPSRIHV